MAASTTTSITNAISTSMVSITLNTPSVAVVLNNQSLSATLYFTFDGTAASNHNYGILPGDTFCYSGPPISVVNIIGSSAQGNYSLFANASS